MKIDINCMTEYDLMKTAKRGVEAEIEDRCQYIAENSARHGCINTLRDLIRKYDAITAVLDELQHKKEAIPCDH